MTRFTDFGQSLILVYLIINFLFRIDLLRAGTQPEHSPKRGQVHIFDNINLSHGRVVDSGLVKKTLGDTIFLCSISIFCILSYNIHVLLTGRSFIGHNLPASYRQYISGILINLWQSWLVRNKIRDFVVIIAHMVLQEFCIIDFVNDNSFCGKYKRSGNFVLIETDELGLQSCPKLALRELHHHHDRERYRNEPWWQTSSTSIPLIYVQLGIQKDEVILSAIGDHQIIFQ